MSESDLDIGIVDGVWSDESDWQVDEFGDGVDGDGAALAMPTVAIVGRPNVGKSTLVNRILGRREAVVEDVPGVTRDRVSYPANVERPSIPGAGHRWLGARRDGHGPVHRPAGRTRDEDRRRRGAGGRRDRRCHRHDEAVARVLRRSDAPVLLAANKTDSERLEAEAASLWSLGLGEPGPWSAAHGRGAGDLLDAILEVLPRPRARPM